MTTRLPRLVGPALALGMMASVSTASLATAQQSVTVQIGPGRDEASGIGMAELTAMGNQTQVVIMVAPANPNMPAHIHADACPAVGPVVFPLQNVQNGRSTTMIDAPLADVLARGRAINLHKGPQEAAIYTGCGNLEVAGAQTAPAAAAPAQAPRPATTAAQPAVQAPAAPAAAPAVQAPRPATAAPAVQAPRPAAAAAPAQAPVAPAAAPARAGGLEPGMVAGLLAAAGATATGAGALIRRRRR